MSFESLCNLVLILSFYFLALLIFVIYIFLKFQATKILCFWHFGRAILESLGVLIWHFGKNKLAKVNMFQDSAQKNSNMNLWDISHLVCRKLIGAKQATDSIKKKRKRLSWPDSLVWFVPFIAWAGGFVLADGYGHSIGLGKSLANLSELFLIGILVFIYVIVRIVYVELMKSRWGDAFISWLFWVITLGALGIGLFLPGLPE